MGLQDYYNIGDLSSTTFGAAAQRAQGFTAGSSYSVTSVRLLLYRIGTPGTVTVSVRATSSGLPTGGDLAVGTIDGNALTANTAGDWVTITFSSSTPLTSGVVYTIVVASVGSSIGWRIDNSAPLYSGGLAASGGGASWTGFTTFDCMFETYGPTVHQIVAACPGSGSGTFTLTGDFLLVGALSGSGILISSLDSTINIIAALIGTGTLTSRLIKLFKFNRSATNSRLVAAGSNKIYYEDI